jgi:hypothetical protein
MLAEADYSTTVQAHNSSAGDDQLLVKFFIRPHPDNEASQEQGRPIFRDTEYISIIQPGNKDSRIERPARDSDRQRFPKHYAAFKNRISDDDVYLEGTPLEEWAGVTRSQVEELRYFGVRTVEQLANMSDSNSQNFMGANSLRDQAKKFLASRADDAAAAEIQARDEEIAEQRELIEALTARLEALEAEAEEQVED